MRILMISLHGDPLAKLGGPKSGGQNNFVKELSLALGRRGCRVDILTCKDAPDQSTVESLNTNVHVYRIGNPEQDNVSKEEILEKMDEFYEEMMQHFKIERYHLLYTNYWLSGWMGLKIRDEYSIPWVHTNHSLGIVKQLATNETYPIRNHIEKLINETADAIIASTEQEKRNIWLYLSKVTPIFVVPLGVSKDFKPLNLPKERFILFAGRLTPQKGFHILAHAFSKLLFHQKYAYRLLVAGGDDTDIDYEVYLPKSDYLKQSLIGIENHVQFLGSQQPCQLAEAFNRSEIVVVPSLYESFGLVAAEAQACGSAVIASKVGGLEEIITHEKTGLHFENQDSDDLVQQLTRVIENQELKNKIEKKAAQHAKSTYCWDQVSLKATTIFHQLMSK